jgi:hypothetical protein
MGRKKKYETTEEAVTIQKKQVKVAQDRYKETRCLFRKHATADQKALIKMLNHSILLPENAKTLLETAKEFSDTKLIADMLPEKEPEKEVPKEPENESPGETDKTPKRTVRRTKPRTKKGDSEDTDSKTHSEEIPKEDSGN